MARNNIKKPLEIGDTVYLMYNNKIIKSIITSFLKPFSSVYVIIGSDNRNVLIPIYRTFRTKRELIINLVNNTIDYSVTNPKQQDAQQYPLTPSECIVDNKGDIIPKPNQ